MHPVNADAVQTVRSIERLKELGKLGPDAASAVPLLLSEDFFLIKGGYTDTDKPLRLATIDTLVRIGDPAVPEVIKLLSMPKGRNNFEWKLWGRVILRKMAKTATVDVIIRLLVEKMQTAQQKHEFYELLASLGPKSIPVLQQEVREILAKKNLALADTNNLRRLGGLLGKEMGPAIDAVIPDRYTDATWGDERYWIHYRGGWYPLAHARPGPQHIPALLDLLRNETLNRERYYEGVRHVGMILSTMGEAPVAPLADLLHADNVETRWAAAFILTMIGNHATTALPALEQTYRKLDEDFGVRVAAARAIGQIKGVESLELYQNIPNLEAQMVEYSRQRSMAVQSREQWGYHFANESHGTKPRHLQLYKRTPEHERALYGLAVGEQLAEHNQWLRRYVKGLLEGKSKTGMGGGIIDDDLNSFLFLFSSRSQHFPGRLEPDVESAMKEYAFRSVDTSEEQRKNRYLTKTTKDLKRILACDDSVFIMEVDNGPIRSDSNSYLILQTLLGDPQFKDRRFMAGDTVKERYDAYNQFYQRGIKQWALHGLWVELGSSNYEYKTYRGLLNLVEFATDPIVSVRAKMYMDLSMVEIEQISLSGLRGGSKSRAKDGGLDGRFNKYLAMLYGEHHGYMLEPPGFANAYRPPTPAVLLRRLGPSQSVYEIANRHPGEKTVAPEGIPQYRHMHKVLSKSVNYAYRTPEYIIGCAMNDIRLWNQDNGKPDFAYGPLGRWSGVIFRDASAVFLEAYTGEKWNVQSGDVMIAQRYPHSHYKGDARVEFVGSLELVERDGWVFVDNDDAFAAVRIARGGCYWNEPARHVLYLEDQYSPILIQTGRKTVYESFEKFQEAILAAPITLTEDMLDYTGPNSKRIEFWMCQDSDKEPYPQILPKIDGEELNLNLMHNYRSPYLNGAVGSNVVTVSYGNRKWEYDFAKNSVTEGAK